MLVRKFFRTAWKYRSQFISMVVMVALGIGVFLGFHMEWYSIKYNTDKFFEETVYADYRIYKETGFSEEEIKKLKQIDGVDAASRVLAVNASVEENDTSLMLFSPEDYNVSEFLVLEGEEYDSESKDFWLSDRYAEANGIEPGDMLTISCRGIEIQGRVAGIGKSAEYMICLADENQLMPDLENCGFVYVPAKAVMEAFGAGFYPQINISSGLEKADLEKAIKKAIGTTTLVTGKDEHTSYAGAYSEIEEGQTMGSVLPILFLAIGILTMVTTMHRIAVNEKIQIGTLKALGFKDRKILAHYTSYGFALGVFGGAAGIGIGYLVGGMIMNENGMMGTYLDMPSWKLVIPGFCWIVLAFTIAFMTFIAFLSVKSMLRGTAAEALQPYVPKKVKPLFMEKFAFWKKIGFAVKWNLRDVIRHKARSLMSLFGIVGCMLLIIGGLGMKDTMSEYMRMLDEVNNYTRKVTIMEDAQQDEVRDFAVEVKGDWQAALSIQLEEEAVNLEIYDIKNDKIRFMNKDGEQVSLSDDGVYICGRLSSEISVGDVIEISPYGEEETYQVKVAGIIRSVMTKNVVMTSSYAEKTGIGYRINAVYTDMDREDINNAGGSSISGIQSKKEIMDTYDGFMEIMDMMVYLLIFAALVLGMIVLYNLGVMSYIERSRELATLKVVGFKDRQIQKILITQNIWLTLVGVLIGLPMGWGVLKLLIVLLADEYELKVTIGIFSYLAAILLTFGVSLVVGYFVSGKNKKIDMVEALKGRE